MHTICLYSSARAWARWPIRGLGDQGGGGGEVSFPLVIPSETALIGPVRPLRPRCVVSVGHGCLALYVFLCPIGYADEGEALLGSSAVDPADSGYHVPRLEYPSASVVSDRC